MVEKTNYTEFEEAFFSIMEGTIKACHKARIFMVGLYSFEKSRFVFANEKLQTGLGEHYNRLEVEGFDGWFPCIHSEERDYIKKSILFFIKRPILFSRLALRYHATISGNSICFRHEIVIRELGGHLIGVNYLLDISEKNEIENSLGLLEKVAESTYLKKLLLNLSQRQREILQLISDGYTSKEIAALLNISNHTVLTHRKNLIEKFKVKNTAQLIKKAWSGILS